MGNEVSLNAVHLFFYQIYYFNSVISCRDVTIMMKKSMVLDQGEVKDERSLGTTHLEEIRCGGRL